MKKIKNELSERKEVEEKDFFFFKKKEVRGDRVLGDTVREMMKLAPGSKGKEGK